MQSRAVRVTSHTPYDAPLFLPRGDRRSIVPSASLRSEACRIAAALILDSHAFPGVTNIGFFTRFGDVQRGHSIAYSHGPVGILIQYYGLESKAIEISEVFRTQHVVAQMERKAQSK